MKRFLTSMALLGMLFCLPLEAADPSFCTAIRKKFPTGSVAPEALLKMLPVAVEAPSAPAGEDFGQGKAEQGEYRTYGWLADAGLGMIQTISGTAECAGSRFVLRRGGKFSPVSSPKGIRRYPCWSDTLWFGTTSGQPAVAEDDEARGDRARALAVSLWKNGAWQPACHLQETHSVKLVPVLSSCRSGVDCDALRSVAVGLAEDEQKARETMISATKTPETDGKGGPKAEMPVFGQSSVSNGYVSIFAPKVSEHVSGNERYRFIVGGGMIGWRIFDGWLVRVELLQPGRPATAVAGFQFARVPDRIVSLTGSH